MTGFDSLNDDASRMQTPLELQASRAIAASLAPAGGLDPKLDVRTHAYGSVTRFYFSDKAMQGQQHGMDSVAGLVSRMTRSPFLLDGTTRRCLTIDCPLETLVQKLPRPDIALT